MLTQIMGYVEMMTNLIFSTNRFPKKKTIKTKIKYFRSLQVE